MEVSGRDGDVAHRGCSKKVLAKFDDDRSITTDLCKGSQSKSFPCTSEICTPTQHYSAHVYADGAARWHAQRHIYALLLVYMLVGIGLSKYTMSGLQYFSMTSIFTLISDSSDVVKDTCVGDARWINRKETPRQDLSNELLIIVFGSPIRKL